MKRSTQKIILTSILILSTWSSILAESTFNNEKKTEVINNLSKAINDGYVLVEKGNQISKELISLHHAGEFNHSSTKDDFVQQINKKLYLISNDKHLSLMPESGGAGPRMVRRVVPSEDSSQATLTSPKESSGPRRMVRATGHGGQTMKQMFGLDDSPSLDTNILPGNIGVLKVHDLMGSVEGVDKAMAELADTDGLIIDVRQCPGGSGEISNQISSYFVPEGEELMSMHTRGQDVRINRSVVLRTGSKRYIGKPFYIITSGFTGSACEALSFSLKYHDLGIIFGESTAGAGHASLNGLTPVGQKLVAFIPDSMPVHPKYKGGFEKVGVSADIETGSLIAVDQAYQMILTQLIEKNKSNQKLSNAVINVTSRINNSLLQQVRDSRDYSELIGDYSGSQSIILDKGQLKIKSPSGRKYPLKKIDNDLFLMIYSRANTKVRVNRDEKNNVVGIALSTSKGENEWKDTKKI